MGGAEARGKQAGKRTTGEEQQHNYGTDRSKRTYASMELSVLKLAIVVAGNANKITRSTRGAMTSRQIQIKN